MYNYQKEYDANLEKVTGIAPEIPERFHRSFTNELTYKNALIWDNRRQEAEQRLCFLLGQIDTLESLGMLTDDQHKRMVGLAYT